MTSLAWSDRDELIARLERLESAHYRDHCDNTTYQTTEQYVQRERAIDALRHEIEGYGDE